MQILDTQPVRARIGGHSVVLYDGVCGLCNRFIQFVLRHDPGGHFLFLPLQDPLAAEILQRHGLQPTSLNSVCVLTAPFTPQERLLLRSDAAMVVLQSLSGPWHTLGRALQLFPRPIRDLGYRIIARVRYRIFGKYASCPLPTPAQRDRFLSTDNAATPA